MDYERPFPDAKAIGLDLETTGLHFWNPDHELVLITLSDGNDVISIQVDQYKGSADLWDLEAFLSNHVFDRIVVCHNASFDIPWLDEWFGCGFPARIFDTMIAEQLLTAGLDLKADLASTVQRRLGIELSKDLQTSFDGSELTPEQIAYAEADAKVLVPLARAQFRLLQEQGLADVWEIEQLATPVFCKMNRNGVRLDRQRLEQLVARAKREMERLECELVDTLTPHVMKLREEKHQQQQEKLDRWLAELESIPADDKETIKAWRADNPRPLKPKLDLSPINLNSQQQVVSALNELGITVGDYRESTLKYTLIRDDIQQEHKDSIVKPLLAYKKQAKLVQAFGDNLLERIQPDGRVYSSFRQVGTDTGRPSSSQPNLLQIPSDKTFRRVFIPEDGHVYIVADFSQIELRIMAEMAGDQIMIDAFLSGTDLHTETARRMFGVEEPTDQQRKVAKAISFGTAYGMSAARLQMVLASEGIDMSRKEADEALDAWRSTYKRTWSQIQRWQREAIDIGYTESATGRKRYFSEPKDGREIGAVKRAGGNFPIQGSSADVTKIAMAMVDQALAPVGGAVVLQVYDEIVCTVTERYAAWAADAVQWCMRKAAEVVLRTVPAEVDCVVSESWAEDGDVPSTPVLVN